MNHCGEAVPRLAQRQDPVDHRPGAGLPVPQAGVEPAMRRFRGGCPAVGLLGLG